MIEFKMVLITIQIYLNNMGWIRIRMDPELLPGSGSRKIQRWIRIQNKSFRIHNTGIMYGFWAQWIEKILLIFLQTGFSSFYQCFQA